MGALYICIHSTLKAGIWILIIILSWNQSQGLHFHHLSFSFSQVVHAIGHYIILFIRSKAYNFSMYRRHVTSPNNFVRLSFRHIILRCTIIKATFYNFPSNDLNITGHRFRCYRVNFNCPKHWRLSTLTRDETKQQTYQKGIYDFIHTIFSIYQRST